MDCRRALFGKLVAASPLLPPPIGVEDVSIKHPRRRVHHALVQERCRDVAQVRGLQLQEDTGVASAGLSLHACARSRKCVRPVVGTRLVIRILPEVFCHLQPAKCQMSRPLTHQPYGYSPFSRTLNPRLKHNLGGQSINKHAQHIVARFGPEQRRTHPDLSLPILLAVVACQSNVGVLFGTCACAHLLCESVNARVKERARERARSILSVRGNGRWVQLSFSTQTKKMSPGSVSVCQYYPICMSLTLYVPTKKLSPFSNGSMLFNASKSVSTYTPPKRSITCVCIHACTQVSMHACIYVCKHVCTYVCMHTCMHTDMHVCMYACIYACMQTFIPHACTHLCTRTCMICTFYVLRARGFGVCADACIFCFAFPPAKQPFVIASVGKKNQEKTSRRTTSESSA